MISWTWELQPEVRIFVVIGRDRLKVEDIAELRHDLEAAEWFLDVVEQRKHKDEIEATQVRWQSAYVGDGWLDDIGAEQISSIV